MRPVDVETGNQPIIFDDSDSDNNEGEEVTGGEGNSGFNPGDYQKLRICLNVQLTLDTALIYSNHTVQQQTGGQFFQ